MLVTEVFLFQVGKNKELYSKSFLQRLKILILDEATNSLDQENEREIINQIISLNDITVFIIAHNIDKRKSADKILYLDQGIVRFWYF